MVHELGRAFRGGKKSRVGDGESGARSLHPRDYFGIVGFFTRAVELKPKDLPQATWNMGDPFTNLQDGLHLAAEMLERRAEPQSTDDRHHGRSAHRLLPPGTALL